MKKLNIYRFVKAPRFEIVKNDNIPRNTPLWVRHHDVKDLISGAVGEENVLLKGLISTFEVAAATHIEERKKLIAGYEATNELLQATRLELADAKKINHDTAENPGILLERAVKAEGELLEAGLKIVELEAAAKKSSGAPKKSKPKASTKTK